MPIQPELLKYSQEYRVLATLRYLFPQEFDNLVTRDAPDLQDKEKGIGIEVTMAANSKDTQAARLFSELSLAQPIKAPSLLIKEIESLGYTVQDCHGVRRLVKSGSISSNDETVFKESIKKKSRKMQKYKSAFPRVGLAILLTEIPARETENNLIQWIEQVDGEIKPTFDFFFVISERFCLYYEPETNISKKRSITREENDQIRSIARKTAEGELTMNSSEWAF